MTLTQENSTFAQTKLITDISTILKKNVGSLRKHLRRRNSSIEKEPKRLLASVSKHLLYILNSHHPLQTKIQEIFLRYTGKSNTGQQEEEEVESYETLDSKIEPVLEEIKDHGVGSNMTEQGMVTHNHNNRNNNNNNYVPLLLNHSSANNNRFPTTNVDNKFLRTTVNNETNNIDGRFDKKLINNVKCQT